MKLGEYLVRSRRITSAQLTDALNAQLIYGGHLGTCLIERDVIDERTLGQALSENSGLPYAEPELLAAVPQNVLDMVPTRLVEKHMAIPFRFEDKILHVAMADPKDLHAIDELSFAAGSRIEPRVSPEVRLFQSMERYYGIPRRQRYVLLARQIDGETQTELTIGHGGVAMPESAETDVERPVVAGFAPRVVHAPTAAATTPADAESLALGSRLCAAKRLDEIADALIDTLAAHATNVVLFRVKGGAIEYWRASRGATIPQSAASRFALISEPLFLLLRGDDHYRGELPEAPEFGNVHRALGITVPAEFLLAPIYVEDRLFGFFYADGGAKPIPVETSTCRRWIGKLGIALHLLLLKRRILAA